MINIRTSVFETNSSSTHAICISKSNVNNSRFAKHVSFDFGEFGWEYEEYDTLYKKASYLYQAICCCCNEDEQKDAIDTITNILKEYGIACEFEQYDEDKDEYGWGCGYIDHGSETIDFVEAVLNDSDKLLRYLFGDSLVITGNDNGESFSDRMYVNEGETVTNWGTYTNYGGLKPEFGKYEVYMKGN